MKYFKVVVSAAVVLSLVSFYAIAAGGQCMADKQACCQAGGQCCAGDKKACCQKACCALVADRQRCMGVKKACCAIAAGGQCMVDKQACCQAGGRCCAGDKKACCQKTGQVCKDPNTAPAFTLTDQNGRSLSLSALSGKIVVLEWFNYDCPFVKAHYQVGTFSRLTEKYAKQAVAWLAVNSTSYATAEMDKEFARQHKLTYPILLDADGKTGRSYVARTTPSVFVIDRQGRIAYRGAVDNAPLGKARDGEKYVNYVEQAVDELLAGKPVSVPQTKSYGCPVKYAAPPPAAAEKKQ